VNRSLPTRKLREHPDLDQLKRQAKELLYAFTGGDTAAVAEVNAHYRDASPFTFTLHDAQLVLARAYGLDSWPKLKAFVDGVTVKRFEDAARNGDIAQLRAMLKQRSELVNSAALRHAVLRRDDAMVRVLMEHGANARTGVYPHRDATSPLVIAADRGYDEIVAIINEAERRRRETDSGGARATDQEELFRAIASGENGRAVSLLESDPSLIQARLLHHGWTPLHVAAASLNVKMVRWFRCCKHTIAEKGVKARSGAGPSVADEHGALILTPTLPVPRPPKKRPPELSGGRMELPRRKRCRGVPQVS